MPQLVTFGYRSSFTSFARIMFRLRFYALLTFLFLPTLGKADDPPAIIDAGVQNAEDVPFVELDYRFQPGQFVYTTFQVTGFRVQAGTEEQPRKIAMAYKVTAEDAN